LAAVARSTMSLSAVMFTIVLGASLFALVFRGFGGDRLIEEILRALPGGTAGAVALVMLAMFVMAFFVDFIEIMFIVVPVTAPALLQMTMPDGSPMSPVWLGVLMAMNLQTSFLHPPLGFALFYLRSVAPPEVSTGDIYRGAIPFVAIQLVMLAILWFAPGLAVWLPAALYGG
ncbi:MAG: TRAP transporter large permease subunit, partial [Pseudomonadota bacterium]|nr:TRAP transporter large permease subunit [Pseudomonadota bacterium]